MKECKKTRGIYVCELHSHLALWGFFNAFPGRGNHGIHAGSHCSNEKNTHLCSNVCPPLCCCARGGVLHVPAQDPRMSLTTTPPLTHYKTDCDSLSSSSFIHLEPVCASAGCPCPIQTKKELQEGRGDEEAQDSWLLSSYLLRVSSL